VHDRRGGTAPAATEIRLRGHVGAGRDARRAVGNERANIADLKAAGIVAPAIAAAGNNTEVSDIAFVLEHHVAEISRADAGRAAEAMPLGGVVADNVAAQAVTGRRIGDTPQHIRPPEAADILAIVAQLEGGQKDARAFNVIDVARQCRVGIVEQVIGGHAIEADRNLTQATALEKPVALAQVEREFPVGRRGMLRGDVVLVPTVRGMALHADFEDVAGAPFLIDLGFADELEARLLDEVRADVGIPLNAVVPGKNRLVHPARNR
jgi:hypothetical protein